MTLADIPSAALEEWSAMGLTHIWLMGVWTTGPASRQRALHSAALRREYDAALPGWREEDVWGSPYAIASYSVLPEIGGDAGLEVIRSQLKKHGLALILDYVPNHLGLDHPWIRERPGRFVQSPPNHPVGFECQTVDGRRWIAHGKDPHFAAWDDTAQLDYRLTDVQEAMIRELQRVASRCDGVRCDMAMLQLQEVFEESWKEFPVVEATAQHVGHEFWSTAIAQVKVRFPQFLFLAEAYWDLEERLQELGFDYTYDKTITDALLHRRPEDLTRRLSGQSADTVRRNAHFLENHDEVRVASVLPPAEHRAAALAVLGLPGMRLLHDGQTSGARIRTPAQLARRVSEPIDPEVSEFYARMLKALTIGSVGVGEGVVLRPESAWDGNLTERNFLVAQWNEPNSFFALVIVNLADHRSQCRVQLALCDTGIEWWQLTDLLGEERWMRSVGELTQSGLFLDVPAHAAQLFVGRPAGPGSA